MWLWIGKISFLSLLLIFLIHYLYIFFLQNLTVPKVKDLVNRPNEQYDNIIKSLKSEGSNKKDTMPQVTPEKKITMKDELKNFLAKEMETKREKPIFSNMDGGLVSSGGNNLNFSSYS